MMETTDFWGLPRTDQVSSLEGGTETFKKKWKKIRNSCAVLCHEGNILVPQNGEALWKVGIPSGSHSESKQWGMKRKVFAALWGGPAFFLCCGKEDHWGDSREDEAVRGGRCGFSAYLSKLFQQEMKATQIRCWLPHWHCPGLQLLQLRLRADLKRIQKKINWEKIPPHMKINPSCTIPATTWI